MVEKTPIQITGLWLRSSQVDPNCLHTSNVEVLLEINGEWKSILVENTSGTISHIIEPAGIGKYAKTPEWLKDKEL